MAGRQSKWDELEMDNKLILVESWCRNGATDKDISERLGVGLTTFYEWKKTKPEIVEVLKRGKEIVDLEVENALFKRALGYKYTEITKEPVQNPATGKFDLEVTKEVVKEVVPDTTAQIFWLKNRKPKDWRDRQNINITNNLEDYSEEDIDKRLKALDESP